jgi:hypothetical protein
MRPPLPPELERQLAAAGERMVFQIEVQFADTTRLLTDHVTLRTMMEAHVSALVETYTSGPKPLVTVHLLH